MEPASRPTLWLSFFKNNQWSFLESLIHSQRQSIFKDLSLFNFKRLGKSLKINSNVCFGVLRVFFCYNGMCKSCETENETLLTRPKRIKCTFYSLNSFGFAIGPFPTLMQHALRPISCNMKFLDYWKPPKVVFLKSHPGHVVNYLTTWSRKFWTIC